MRVEAERAGDQHVEVGIGGFVCGSDQVGTGDGAELGADKNASAALGTGDCGTFEVAPLGADQLARPRRKRGEGYAVVSVRLLHAGGLEVLQDHGREVLRRVVTGLALGEMIDQFVVLADAERAVRRQALHCERACDADDSSIVVWLVVKKFEVGLRGDGCVDFFVPSDARLPLAAVELRRTGVPRVARLVGDVLKVVRDASRSQPQAPVATALTAEVKERIGAALIAPVGIGKTIALRMLVAALPETRFGVHDVKVTGLSKRDLCKNRRRLRPLACRYSSRPSAQAARRFRTHRQRRHAVRHPARLSP